MRLWQWSRRMCAIGAVIAVAMSPKPAAAQNITTGVLSGTVTDAQAGVLPGANVTATNTATGTKYEAVTGADGRFEIPNVRVGQYAVTASLSGFKDQTQPNITVSLGETHDVDFKLALATLTESVTVTAQAQVIDTARAGTAENIPSQEIQALPTIQRSITDVARTSPFVNAQTFGGASSAGVAVSVAGRNNRYNNMQIDGAVNNDLFGLAATGTPGGQTGTQPISYDALQEIQIVVAPYDVRQGGFSGGGINAITKSGTNSYSGTGYIFGQNQGLVGKIPGVATPATPSPADTAVGTFTSKQGGFSVGGPIVQNKAFFFGNVDLARQNTPSGFSLDGSSGQAWNPADLATAQQALAIIKNQYGFDPGGLGQFSKPQNSDKIFVRTDFNVSSKNQLMVRVNYVNGLTDVGTPSNATYYMPDNYYQIQDKVLSTVGELNTTFGNAYNDFRITYQRERNVRGDQPGFSAFPLVRVDMPDNNYILLGTDNSSTANKLNQDIVEINDDITFVKGKHTITVGTHNELFKFYNLFIQNLYGNYEFSSLANLQAGLAQSFSHFYSNDPNNPLLAAQFSVQQYGVYGGDQWRVASNLTLTYGARFEAPHFPDVPHANPVSVADFGYRTDIVPSPKMFSPRVGFNWDLSKGSGARSQIRGGIGSFAGRTPYVWLSDQYGNTGVDFTQITATFSANNKIPFVANPNAQPLTVTGGAAGRQTINLVDPNYKYPQILRGNLAYDRDLGFWGLYGTAEILFTKNLEDIAYENLNYVPAGTQPDGRILYKKFDSNLNDVILLTNTTQGASWTTAFKVERPFKNGFYASAAYSYNHATSINDGTSSVAASNWGFNPVGVNVNNPPLTTSAYQAGNRIQLTTAIPIPLGKGLTSTAAFYYNGQQGQPYVVLFNGDVNGDGKTSNDILYVPSDASQVNVTNGTFAQLQAFLSNDCSLAPFTGQIATRNTCTSPWTNDLDFRYAVRVPTGSRAKVELTMDVFNLLNLLDKNWGWVYYPNFNSPTLIGGSSTLTNGKETYNLSTITSPTFQGTFTRDNFRSRWQAQWGARIRF